MQAGHNAAWYLTGLLLSHSAAQVPQLDGLVLAITNQVAAVTLSTQVCEPLSVT